MLIIFEDLTATKFKRFQANRKNTLPYASIGKNVCHQYIIKKTS